jgi:predicted dehydrogenase
VSTTFATIGSGRRTRFFLRLARAMPERLRVRGVVTRDPGRADALTTDWGVPAFGTVGDLLPYERPDYIAAAVRHGAPPPVDPADAVTTLTVLEAARRSATERRVVTLGIAR